MTIAPKLLTEPPELIADVIASAVNAASREAEKVVEAQAGSISALFTSKK
jgi:DNA-binding protein YbaB